MLIPKKSSNVVAAAKAAPLHMQNVAAKVASSEFVVEWQDSAEPVSLSLDLSLSSTALIAKAAPLPVGEALTSSVAKAPASPLSGPLTPYASKESPGPTPECADAVEIIDTLPMPASTSSSISLVSESSSANESRKEGATSVTMNPCNANGTRPHEPTNIIAVTSAQASATLISAHVAASAGMKAGGKQCLVMHTTQTDGSGSIPSAPVPVPSAAGSASSGARVPAPMTAAGTTSAVPATAGAGSGGSVAPLMPKAHPAPDRRTPAAASRGTGVPSAQPPGLASFLQRRNGCRSVTDFRPLPGNNLGEGAYGVVRAMLDPSTGERVAIKQIKFEAETEGIPITLMREIRALSALRHPNIIGLREMITSKPSDQNRRLGDVFMVFDIAPTDLRKLYVAAPGSRLPVPQVQAYMYQILAGLAHMHQQGWLHRDLKPANVLMMSDHTAKIADFGLAKPTSSRKRSPTVVTLWYRAPEILLQYGEQGPALDVWSAGVILLELLLGHPPFTASEGVDQMQQIYKLCGEPAPGSWPGVERCPLWYQGMRPRKMDGQGPRTPQFRCRFPSFPPLALDLVERMLTLNPAARITAAEAMRHPWFTGAEAGGGMHGGLAFPDKSSFPPIPMTDDPDALAVAAGRRGPEPGASVAAKATVPAPLSGHKRPRSRSLDSRPVDAVGANAESLTKRPRVDVPACPPCPAPGASAGPPLAARPAALARGQAGAVPLIAGSSVPRGLVAAPDDTSSVVSSASAVSTLTSGTAATVLSSATRRPAVPLPRPPVLTARPAPGVGPLAAAGGARPVAPPPPRIPGLPAPRAPIGCPPGVPQPARPKGSAPGLPGAIRAPLVAAAPAASAADSESDDDDVPGAADEVNEDTIFISAGARPVRR